MVALRGCIVVFLFYTFNFDRNILYKVFSSWRRKFLSYKSLAELPQLVGALRILRPVLRRFLYLAICEVCAALICISRQWNYRLLSETSIPAIDESKAATIVVDTPCSKVFHVNLSVFT